MQYKNPFDNQDLKNYTETTFGESVRIRRQQLNIELRDLAKQIGMSQSYLCEIENGKKTAPSGANSGIDYIARLINVLDLNSSQQINLKIMADFSRMSNKYMISYFFDNPNALKILIMAIKEGWNDEQWERIFKLIQTN